MLKLENINKSYTIRNDLKQEVLRDLNVSFPDKGFVSIVGNSGSGKTTLLNIVAGLDHIDSGKILYNGQEIKDYEKYRRERVGVVFQEFNLIAHLNIVDNVLLSMSDDCKNKRQVAEKVLCDLGLEECLHKKPRQLSGGQQQRVAIARMIAMDVDIFICDEPTGSLDKGATDNIVQLLKELSQDKLIIFVTHNLDIAKTYSDEILEMENGNISELANKDVKHAKHIKKNREYNNNVKWLALKNLFGRLKDSSKYVLITAFIMFISAVSIILDSEVFKEYIHEYYVDQGIKNVLVYKNHYDVDLEDARTDLATIENVRHVADGYYSEVKMASTNLEKNKTPEGPLSSEMVIQEVTTNDYIKEIVTDGRFPEAPDEIMLSAEGAIIVLKDLKIGGQRLYDQFMTGKVTSKEVFDLIDDKRFIIAHRGYPRVRVVGLVADKKIQENKQTIYFVDGFKDLFEYPWGLYPDYLYVYKDSLYKEDETALLEYIENNEDLLLNPDHHMEKSRIYSKIESLKDLSKLSLVVIVVIAAISYISLIASSILERKYEIGLYRTTGYSRINTSKILGYEMLFINVCSVVIVAGLLTGLVRYAKNAIHGVTSYMEVVNNLNIFSIMGVEIVILLFFTASTLYFSYKRILKDSVIANIKDL